MNKSAPSRNHFMLKNSLAKQGYDWWWHSFTAVSERSGEQKAFFIEYYICNPSLGEDQAVLGQKPENRKKRKKPSYGMMKAGVWGKGGKQIHNFYPIPDTAWAEDRLDIRMGDCRLSENEMRGSVTLSENESLRSPELMSDSGTISWDLKIDKKIAFHVGYGASAFLRRLNAFEMFWHAEGMKTEYSGSVVLDGESYAVYPESSYGYADKNWGRDFTSPWLWLSSCNLRSRSTGKILQNSAFDFGGGKPKVFGLPLNRKLLGSFVHEGDVHEYNFSKFWKYSDIQFSFKEGSVDNCWKLIAQNRKTRFELELSCPRDEMILINYESPDGKKRHERLWNGGTARGTARLFKRHSGDLIDAFEVQNAGCEYGEYQVNHP